MLALYSPISKYGDWLSPAKIFQDELPFLGEKLGWILSGFFAIVLLVEWWLAMKKDYPRMLWTAALTLAMTPLLGLPTYPQNYAVLIIPLIVALSVMSNRWSSSRTIIIDGLLVFLFVGLWAIAIFATDVKTALFFPLPVFVILLLYWIKWWVVSRPLEFYGLNEELIMRWYHFVILGILGLLIPVTVAYFQPSPGYMDADYYFAGGVRLADGYGFSERILWNYLDNPEGLPHPSHAYWMPLASLIASLGMVLTGIKDFPSARLGFLPNFRSNSSIDSVPRLSITKKAGYAFTAGLLAVFSGYYIPYYSTTDTFGIYMLLGIFFFLFLGYAMTHLDPRSRSLVSVGLGVIAGLAHFSRADGILWLAMALLSVLLLGESNNKRRMINVLFVLFGYLVVMTPWFLRNYSEFGTPLAPGGNHAFWLTSYDQTYSYPASKLTFNSWLDSGWRAIFSIQAGRHEMESSNCLGCARSDISFAIYYCRIMVIPT